MTLVSADTALLLLINQGSANSFFDLLMPFLTSQGYLLVLPFIFLLLFKTLTKRGAGRPSAAFLFSLFLVCCAAVLVTDSIEHLLKVTIGRVRPCRALDGVRLIIACPRSFSLPSGHAAGSFAFAVPLFVLSRDYAGRAIRMYPLLLAAAIAFSRVYLGVHYPSDIVAGGLLGAAIGLLFAFLFRALMLRLRGARDS